MSGINGVNAANAVSTGGRACTRRFDDLAEVITQQEILEVIDGYRRTAGFALEALHDGISLADRDYRRHQVAVRRPTLRFEPGVRIRAVAIREGRPEQSTFGRDRGLITMDAQT